MRTNVIIIVGICFLLEFYAFQAVRLLTRKSFVRVGYWVLTFVVYACAVSVLFIDIRSKLWFFHIAFALFASLGITKLFLVIPLLIDDVLRLMQFGVGKLASTDAPYPSRKKFLSLLGVGLFSLASLAVLDGVLFGRFRHRVRRVRLKIAGLPSRFKGYKVVQISDLHSGSFHNAEKLRFTIDMINAEKPDLVLFTGDAVNDYATEFVPFISLFKAIEAKDGKYSVLGNHDYGMYAPFPSEEKRKENIETLIQHFRDAGFTMLRNESVSIIREGEKIELVGVENWGLPPFPQYGDLDKALKGTDANTVKILMSHDPSHFDAVVVHHSTKIHLTLSGHTHGMQFGIDLKNIKWSPVQYRYPKWVDLYQSNNRYLYVNRGFGVIGFPGRVGINPEITLFTMA